MNRREFLHFSGTAGLALAGAQSLPALAAEAPYVGVAKGAPAAATRAAVNLLGGMGRFVKAGQKVVIKPNMSFPHPPEHGTNTHPEVVREIAAMCREAGASRVLVLDNPLRSGETCLEQSGIRAACAALQKDMVFTLTDAKFFETAPIPQGVELKTTDVMKDVLAADVLIAAPVAKSHSATGVSMSMKGMMGLIRDRGVMHGMDLNQAVVDLCSLLAPKVKLAVVDATRCLSTNGPFGPGEVLRLDTVIASPDMVAADAMGVSVGTWYGRQMKPGQVPHIKLAHERGLGRMDLDNLPTVTTQA